MNETADMDPRQEIKRHIDEFRDPNYMESHPGEENSRLDFMEALAIYISDEDFPDIHYTVRGYLNILKDTGAKNEVIQKSQEKNMNLKELMDKNLNLDDDEAGDEVVALLYETLE